MDWEKLAESDFYIWSKTGRGEEKSEFRLKPKETCLVIIDMQKGFIYPEFGMAKVYAHLGKRPMDWQLQRMKATVIPNLQRLLSAFREQSLKIIHVTTGAEMDDLSDLARGKREQILKEQERSGMDMKYRISVVPDMEIIDELKPRHGEIVMNKRAASVFTGTSADFVLKNMGVTDLVVTGISTDGCAGATAMNGSDYGYHTAMVEDCCSSFLREGHYAFLDYFRARYGRVCSTEDVLHELRQT